MSKTKKEFYKKFGGKKLKAINLNNEFYLMGKIDDCWEWIEKAFQEAREEGWQTGHKQTKEDYQAKEEEVVEIRNCEIIKLQGKYVLTGKVYGHPSFENGMEAITSGIKKVETKNTKYILSSLKKGEKTK